MLRALCSASLLARGLRAQSIDAQYQQQQPLNLPDNKEDEHLPDGRSQKNAIAKQQHAEALKEADQLADLADALRDELRKAGTFVIPVGAVKKTEEIEKLAKRIRGRLKY